MPGYHGQMSTQLPPRMGRRIKPISVEEALAMVLDAIQPMPVIERSIELADGLVLAEDVRSPIALPAFRNSAMDGFALRASDSIGASSVEPKSFSVAGSTAAGESAWGAPLDARAAVRVMTGAVLPDQADAVVRFEDVEELGDRVSISGEISAGTNIRNVGSDLRLGDVAVGSGSLISWASGALLTSIGVNSVRVHSQPRVAVVSTGDELRADRYQAGAETIPDSNGPMLLALARDCGADVIAAGIARDSRDSLERALVAAISADVIVISGGVSAGDRDAVRDLLIERNAIVLSQVRMKPGRPFTFAILDGKPVFALPGNPFAAAATFLQFVKPALDRLRGRRIEAVEIRWAEIAEPVANSGGRRAIVPVRLRPRIAALPVAERISQGVAGLALLARADALLVIPESIAVAEAGSVLEFWPLPR
ncbi:molybdopterin molybdotransferase MoeA [soil metagenome]